MNWFGDNQFASGGLILILAGTIVALCRKLPLMLWSWFVYNTTTTVEILEKDNAYSWVQIWLAKKMSNNRNVAVYTKHTDPEVKESVVDNRPNIFFTPSAGTHFFWYKKRPVIITKSRQDITPVNSNTASGSDKETIIIRIIGRDASFVKEIISEARDCAIPLDGKISIWINKTEWQTSWLLINRIEPRSLKSIVLEDHKKKLLVNDIENFFNSKDWYSSVGVPYRRGYLLEGPPGSGKTSLVVAIASYFKMNIYLLNLSSENTNDAKLTELLSQVSHNSIILIEDIDCAFNGRKNDKDPNEKSLTFSGLLNALDGVASKDGRIIFMTTNHVEKLDPALIRPGRTDVRLHIGYATEKQIKDMFKSFYPNSDDELSNELSNLLTGKDISMANLQGHFIKYHYSPEKAVENISEIAKRVVA